MYLLIESPYVPQKQKVVVKKTNKVIFETTLQSLDTPNRNNRIYESVAIKTALESEDLQERMQKKNFGGELDHPIPTSDQLQSQIRHTTFLYKEASHAITECSITGKEVEAVVETLSTPNGYTMAGLINDGVQVGFSLRAIGDNVRRVGNVEYVQPPVTIIAYDCVSFPSHREAYMGEIKHIESSNLLESTQYICKDGICFLIEHINRVKNIETSNGTKLSSVKKILESKTFVII